MSAVMKWWPMSYEEGHSGHWSGLGPIWDVCVCVLVLTLYYMHLQSLLKALFPLFSISYGLLCPTTALSIQ